MNKPKLKIDQERHEIHVGDKFVRLARKEWALLILLKEAAGRVQSRDQILKSIWGYGDGDVDTRTVDQHITRLRRKIGIPVVETVTGFGYKYIGEESGKSGQDGTIMKRDPMMSKQRVTPTECPHCVKGHRTPTFVHEPPAWIKVLYALRTGIKGDRTGTVGTPAQIAERMGVSRQRVHLLIADAHRHGALELPYGPGCGVYRKSSWGKQLLQSWIRAGWTGAK